ncbi:MAG: DUF4382 domain-containing protein [Oligoflexales bacterium]
MTIFMQNFRYLRAAVALALVTLFVACSGTFVGNPTKDDETDTKPTTTTTTLPENKPGDGKSAVTISLTDAPFDTAKEVWLTIEKVKLQSKVGEWKEISLVEAKEIDLLSYSNGESIEVAASADVLSGDYIQTVIVLSQTSAPRLVLEDGEEHELSMHGDDYELKIEHDFSVIDEDDMALTIDIDLRHSIVEAGESGKYMLKPVMRMVETEKTGSINGKDSGGKTVCLYSAGSTLDETAECPNAIASMQLKKKGEYTFGFLEEGTYTVRVFQANGSYDTIEGVVVESGEAKDLE